MNTLAIVLIAAVCLAAAYLLYGRWLANKWGIDPAAKTPAQAHEDGQDYVPTKGFTVFCHQFSSIAGAGPVTGAIQAAAFGWLPVLLWVLLGGIFFGAVTDFGALYASVKNDGKSIGLLIEKYIGKLGRKLFLLFCWLFTLLVIAAFADMVAGTFNAFTTVDGQVQLSEAARPNGAAGTISLLIRYGIWRTAEEIQPFRLESNRCRSCLHRSSSGNRYGSSDHRRKKYLDLHYLCLYLLRSSSSDLAAQTAP